MNQYFSDAVLDDYGGGKNQPPLNLGKQTPFQHSEAILMVETFRGGISYFTAGWYVISPLTGSGDVRNPNTNVGVFTYNRRAARGYLDGHAISSDSTDIGWIARGSLDGDWTYTLLETDGAVGAALRKSPWAYRWR